MAEDLIPAEEAAALLGVHRSVVHYLAKAGELTAYRIVPPGKNRALYYFSRAQVQALGNSWRKRAPRRPRRRAQGETGGAGGDAGARPPIRRRKVAASRRGVV